MNSSTKSEIVCLVPELLFDQAAGMLERIAYSNIAGNPERPIIPLFVAPPGVGKNALINDLLRNLNSGQLKENIINSGAVKAEDYKEWEIFPLRVSQKDNVGIAGACTIVKDSENQSYTYTAPPAGFPLLNNPSSAKGKNILIVLDEFGQAVPAVQSLAASYLDGEIGSERFDPSRVLLVILTNGVKDGAASNMIPAQIRNRVVMFSLKPSIAQWTRDFALKNGIPISVISYLNEKGNSYFFLDTQEELKKVVNTMSPFQSPRSWTTFSNLLSACYTNEKLEHIMSKHWDSKINPAEDAEQNLIRAMAIGALGLDKGNDFITWLIEISKLVRLSDIISGTSKDASQISKESHQKVLFYISYQLRSFINSIGAEFQEFRNSKTAIDPKNPNEVRDLFQGFFKGSDLSTSIDRVSLWIMDLLSRTPKDNLFILIPTLSLILPPTNQLAYMPISNINEARKLAASSETVKRNLDFTLSTWPMSFVDLYSLCQEGGEKDHNLVLSKYSKETR